MKKRPRIVWLAAGCLVLAARGAAPVSQAPDAATANQATCDCSAAMTPQASDIATANKATCDFSAAMTPQAPERYRAWVLFYVDDPQGAAAKFGVLDDKGLSLLTDGGNDYVIVRADVVDGNEQYNLVVPVDAANEDHFKVAIDRLTTVVGEQRIVLRVGEHFPTPPHRSATFVTEKELAECFLPEYFPSGRHPQSPGANPWG